MWVHIWMRMTEIRTPCIDKCELNKTGQYCIGCGRSLDEIAGWGSMEDDERRAVIEKLPERLQQLKA